MYYKIKKYTLFSILASSDCKKMKHSSFESSQWNESNGGSFVFLGAIDAE
jgi:hypothetical protein